MVLSNSISNVPLKVVLEQVFFVQNRKSLKLFLSLEWLSKECVSHVSVMKIETQTLDLLLLSSPLHLTSPSTLFSRNQI